jgi:hypothetical protein
MLTAHPSVPHLWNRMSCMFGMCQTDVSDHLSRRPRQNQVRQQDRLILNRLSPGVLNFFCIQPFKVIQWLSTASETASENLVRALVELLLQEHNDSQVQLRVLQLFAVIMPNARFHWAV